ncbi:uncharacterized protein LOC111604832 isoform X2 [Drosophila hydei]|uniref:Uncharacterized protein LOC111604832 isoform X2 n=1 Tax=Drosophila hydei TaxID=7224 RepID=A0A6J1MIB5_DROHY|nr:uncharacterized protein LOC111604832 isoform X2 [Drosophila hydei]
MNDKKDSIGPIENFTDDLIIHPQYDEKFLQEPSKVEDTIQFLESMLNSNKTEDIKKTQKKTEIKPDVSDSVTDSNFIIFTRLQNDRFSLKRKTKIKLDINMNQFTFMRQIDKSVQERMQARIERERVANNFRRSIIAHCDQRTEILTLNLKLILQYISYWYRQLHAFSSSIRWS